MVEKQTQYHAYLMRLWRDDPQTPWRGSLENPQTGERQHFASVVQLIETIAEQTNLQGDNHGTESDNRFGRFS